jgi:hypothetical protein
LEELKRILISDYPLDELRKKYGIKPGDKVELKVVNGAIRVKPVK